jgi:iron complex transport system substrate-binding protein
MLARRQWLAHGFRPDLDEDRLVVERQPDLIIGSWCGKKFRPERVMARPGFERTPAVQHQEVYEIKSSMILQPGPAALTDGLAELHKIIRGWAALPFEQP